MRTPYHLWKELPEVSGVYVVWAGNVCLYVGSSKSIQRRFKSHTRKKEFAANGATHIEVFAFPEENLGAEETAAIYRYHPTLNGIVGRPKVDKATDTVAVRYTIGKDDHQRLLRLQEKYKEKLHLLFLSQTDFFRLLLKDAEAAQ